MVNAKRPVHFYPILSDCVQNTHEPGEGGGGHEMPFLWHIACELSLAPALASTQKSRLVENPTQPIGKIPSNSISILLLQNTCVESLHWLRPPTRNFGLGIPACWYLKTLTFVLPQKRNRKCVFSPTQNPNTSQ